MSRHNLIIILIILSTIMIVSTSCSNNQNPTSANFSSAESSTPASTPDTTDTAPSPEQSVPSSSVSTTPPMTTTVSTTTSPITTTVATTTATTTTTSTTTTTVATTPPPPLWTETTVEKQLYVNTDCYSRKDAILGAATTGLHYINELVTIVAETNTEYYKLVDGSFIHKDYLSEEKVVFESYLNVIRIEAAGIEKVDTENYIPATITIDGSDIVSAEAEIRGRGHSTWEWDKKPYKIKFKDKLSILGMKKSKEWVLLANYADESLIRNYVAHEISKALDGIEYTFSQIPVIVYINDEYQGIYTIGEQIEVKEGRVDLIKDATASDTSFMIELGGKSDDETDITAYKTGFLLNYVIKYPKQEKLTNNQFNYITNYLYETNNAIVKGEKYEEYIDVDSFIDWFILHELSYNLDSCMRRSCYLYKNQNGKLCMGPVWDFDLAFGNFLMDNPHYNDWATLGTNSNDILDKKILKKITPDNLVRDDKDNYIVVNWFNFLLTDDAFVSRLKERWFQIRGTVYNTAINAVDKGQNMIGHDYIDDMTLWYDYGKKRGHQSYASSTFTTYQEHITYLRNFIVTRYKWLDNAIVKLQTSTR